MSQQNLPTPPEQQPTPQPEPNLQLPQQPQSQPQTQPQSQPQSPIQLQSQTQAPTPPAGPESNHVSLVNVIAAITTAVWPSQLNQYLKTFAPKEVRDLILASALPDGRDPLSVLDIQANTLGILHILCVARVFFVRVLTWRMIGPHGYIRRAHQTSRSST